jgi:hypothetical protein
MEATTVFQVYAEMRRAEAAIRKYEEARQTARAMRERANLREAQAELDGRIRRMAEAGERMPEHFTRCAAAEVAR